MKGTVNVEKDLVIVGGGIAGIYAALRECDRRGGEGCGILLIESSSRLGGRIQTIYKKTEKGLSTILAAATSPLPGAGLPSFGAALTAAGTFLNKGIPLEAGAGRFTSKHRLLLGLLDRYGLDKYPLTNEKNYVEVGGGLGDPVRSFDKIRGLMPVPPARCRLTFGEYIAKHIDAETARNMRNSFGYNAEYDLMNAADAWRMFDADFTSRTKFFAMPGGLSVLVEKMVAELRERGVEIGMRTKLVDFSNGEDGGISLVLEKRLKGKWDGKDAEAKVSTMRAGRLVLAIPQKALSGIRGLGHMAEDLAAVVSVPLNRIYAKWPGAAGDWMKGIPKTTTDNVIRQYIPALNGIAMIYNDADDADYWNGLGAGSAVKRAIRDNLRKVFAGLDGIGVPSWIVPCYWPEGEHLWRPGFNSATVAKRIARPFGVRVPVYIVGEAYAVNQGWIEGALESVRDAGF